MINNPILAFMLALVSAFIQSSNALEPIKPIEKSSQTITLISEEALAVTDNGIISSSADKTAYHCQESTSVFNEVNSSTSAIKEIRGIHITSWGAGSRKLRTKLLKNIDNSVINTVIVAIKETDGRVYIPGVKIAKIYGSTLTAIPNPKEMMEDFDKRGLYTIARIVVFKDSFLPEIFPELGVKNSEGDLWRDRKGGTWTDPYNRKIWKYNMEVAKQAAKLGFDEIQFDYIRYPSEGNISECQYSKPHNSVAAIKNIANFLKYARKHLKPYDVKLSAAIFGLTTTAKTDMGIGQDIRVIARNTDFIYPMMYPSHYYSGQYGLKDPDSMPFKVVNLGLTDASQRLGEDYYKLRPYLQDFSLRHKYGPYEIRAQILAAKFNSLKSWILWNPSNRYNWKALTPESYRSFIDPYYK
ncbi:MAG: putative glycoside hydrolase [Elusimicrobia bacterium]|nr:putative glycoside hydrolase [Elusimicrobiota bacterium]